MNNEIDKFNIKNQIEKENIIWAYDLSENVTRE